MSPNFLFKPIQIVALLCACWVAVGIGDRAQAQDTVVERKADGTTINRRGRIVQWAGVSLKLDNQGSIREIDNDTIVSFQTQWPPEIREGESQLERGQCADAVKNFSSAVASESRQWARNIILSKLLAAQQQTGNTVAAAESFFQLTQSDPSSRFLHLAPLPWETDGMLGVPPTAQQARAWLSRSQTGGDQPSVRLVAAAWLAHSNDAGDADDGRALLEELAGDLDPTIAALAVGQLWRQRVMGQVRPVAMNEKQISVWRKRLSQMPESARAGPLYVIATAESRASQVEDAVRDYMRIVILYPDQPIIVAPALYRAGDLLHNEGQDDLAAGLMLELKTKFPNSQ